ncbi:MAG: hypothetical protein ABUL56_02520, partial [Actinomycetota bacterium]
MARSLPATVAVALIFVALAVLPNRALAGGYNVHACNASVAGGANHSWGAVADPGMTAYTDCPGGQGMVARNVYDGSVSTFLQGAYMIFDAPEGNSVEAISFELGMRRPDCTWTVAMIGGNRDLSGNLIFGLPANGYCDSQFQTPNEYTFIESRWSYPVGAPRVRIEARCGAGSCTRNGVAGIHMRNVDVRVRDDIAPALSGGRGALWTAGTWLSGSQSVGFDARDAAGIQSVTVSVDGREVARRTNSSCDFTLPSPCSQMSMEQPFSTAGFGADGGHMLTIAATDAAGNTASHPTPIYIDNSPPDPPQNLAVVGGEAWRSTNDFAIAWKITPPAVGAPVVGAEWNLCPVAGGACTRGSANGVGLTTIPHLKLPAPGAYTLKLWLRDQAGNQDQRLAAPP